MNRGPIIFRRAATNSAAEGHQISSAGTVHCSTIDTSGKYAAARRR
jgi:hypothetical protein